MSSDEEVLINLTFVDMFPYHLSSEWWLIDLNAVIICRVDASIVHVCEKKTTDRKKCHQFLAR